MTEDFGESAPSLHRQTSERDVGRDKQLVISNIFGGLKWGDLHGRPLKIRAHDDQMYKRAFYYHNFRS